MTEVPSVLIIDDEAEAAALLALHFQRDGYQVYTANSGPEGLKLAYAHRPSAVVLDVRMPGMDGYEVCGRLRDFSDAVILFVTVVSDREAIVRGLQLGADDYLIKPFNYLVLLARIEACLRRRSIQRQRGDAVRVPFTDWTLDTKRREVIIGERQVQLTPKEFDVLRYFMQHPDAVHTADEILEKLWGPEYVGDPDLVKQFVYRLRSKLEPDPSEPQYFVTIRGSGYAFEPDTQPDMRTVGGRTAPSPAAESPATAAGQPGIAIRRAGDGSRGRTDSARILPSTVALSARWALPGVLVLVLLGAVFVAQASATALPGDRSYGIRAALHALQLIAPLDRSDEVALHLQFSEGHIREISELMEAGRPDDVLLAVAELGADLERARGVLDRVANDDPVQALQLIELSEQRLALQLIQLSNLRGIAGPPAGAAIDYAIEVAEMERDTLRHELREKAFTNLGELLGQSAEGDPVEPAIPLEDASDPKAPDRPRRDR